MPTKSCFKCGQSKPLSEYYTHKRMADGHLNKCIQCTKRDSQATTARKSSDPTWIIAERKRKRELQRRIVEAKGPPQFQGKKTYCKKQKQAVGIANKAYRKGIILKEPCIICGNPKAQGHHENYDKPLDVIWLCTRHHNDRHIHLRDCITLGIKPEPITKGQIIAF